MLVEVNCETDFVARTDFQDLVHDLAMQVAAANLYLSRADISEETVAKERHIYEKAKASGRPPQAVPKIVEGRLEKYFQEVCLLDQPFVKDPSMTIQDLIKAKIAKTGENITVRRFVRFNWENQHSVPVKSVTSDHPKDDPWCKRLPTVVSC